MKHLLILNLMALSLIFTACGNTDNDDILAQQTAKAQDAANKASSEEMEADLDRTYRFYEAVAGSYAGVLQTKETKYKIKIDLYLSHPRYPKDPKRKTRTVNEIEHDIKSLSFIAYVNLSTTSDAIIADGCVVEKIVPDINNGKVTIASSNCKNTYPIFLSNPNIMTAEGLKTLTPAQSDEETEETLAAKNMAKALLDGKVNKVLQLRGQVKFTQQTPVYELLVTRE